MTPKAIADIDEALLKAAKRVKVLNALAWPGGLEEKFLAQWRAGNPELPVPSLKKPNLATEIALLESLAGRCDKEDPVGNFLSSTARSYADGARLLQAIGTPDFTKYSCKLYGRPDYVYKAHGLSAVDAAKFFIELTDNLLGSFKVQPTLFDIPATDFAGWLKTEVDEFFDKDAVEVFLDPNLSSKALAGATRIRIRGNALFSTLDKNQLLYHEAFVHTATILNGSKQTNLKSLGLGAPRTTGTQEGLAVMAELITNAMDISRLRRIALRVLAVKQAMDGADFLDVFKFFLEGGQSEEESFKSSQRIFRGGAVKGGVVFTKDSVYLIGVLAVHTFMRVAIRDNRPELIRMLFCGRLTLGDAVRLSPFLESGWLNPPVYMPEWATDLRRLAALLAYSAFITNIKLEKVELANFAKVEDEQAAS